MIPTPTPTTPCPFYRGQRIFSSLGYYRGVIDTIEYSPTNDDWVGYVAGGCWWVMGTELSDGAAFIGKPPKAFVDIEFNQALDNGYSHQLDTNLYGC